jgi:NhaC family Na+:H+ antiporter
MEQNKKSPNVYQALAPIVVLLALIVINIIFVYGDDALAGPNQVALIVGTVAVCFIGIRLKYKWKELLNGMTKSIGSALPAMIILIIIGALAGTWLISGVVPTMIYYGLTIIHPSIFLFAACLVSAIISLATGSSWTTIATVGVALLAIGDALGYNTAVCAGAIISGAYFGDKMSPLSDTTNLAPAMAGTDLFTHIKYMMWTTVPSITITLIVFLVWGFTTSTEGNVDQINNILVALDSTFNITPWLFLVPVAVVIMIILKVPAIPALLGGVLLGGIFAMLFQADIIASQSAQQQIVASFDKEGYEIKWSDGQEGLTWDASSNAEKIELKIQKNGLEVGRGFISYPEVQSEINESNFVISLDDSKEQLENVTFNMVRSGFAENSYRTIIDAMVASTVVPTGVQEVDDLLGTKGMDGMLNTIFLILCAMSFGGAMEVTGMLRKLSSMILSTARSVGGLIASTSLTCLGFNATASDQYLAIVVPGKMFADAYKEKGLAPQNLSRTLEDSATVTSVLIPWNTCGAYQSGVLGIATGEYWMYCFFNLISPVMTMTFGYLGIKIAKSE